MLTSDLDTVLHLFTAAHAHHVHGHMRVALSCRRMSKRDAEKLAREIWAAKDEAEAAGAPRTHLADVTAAFLERRYFAIPRLVTEVGLGCACWLAGRCCCVAGCVNAPTTLP
jgi:hypothetical protein